MKYDSFEEFFDAFHLCPACKKETDKVILIDEGDGDSFISYSLKSGVFTYKCENRRGEEFAGGDDRVRFIPKEKMKHLLLNSDNDSDHFIEARCREGHRYNANCNYKNGAYFYMSSIYDSEHIKYYHTLLDTSDKDYILISTPGRPSLKMSYPLGFFDLSDEPGLVQKIEKLYLL